jgi:tetratricopeptide (TPR) repeat protein
MQLQRQDGDPELYRDAERALREGLRRAPGDYQTEKLLAWVLAGQHRFDEALAISRRLAAANPADYWNYGVIGDALTETGDYAGAVAAVQRMVDRKPGGLSYARAAHLRRLHGDTDGALNLYALALEATSAKDREATAWLRTQRGDLRFTTGDLEGAATEYDAAVRSLPDYRRALAGQAHLVAALGRLDEAAGKYEKLLAAHERPDWRAALGDLYKAQGETEQAEAEYRRVEAF